MAKGNVLTCKMEGGIAVVSIDRPPLNVLSFDNYKEVCETMMDLI